MAHIWPSCELASARNLEQMGLMQRIPLHYEGYRAYFP